MSKEPKMTTLENVTVASLAAALSQFSPDTKIAIGDPESGSANDFYIYETDEGGIELHPFFPKRRRNE